MSEWTNVALADIADIRFSNVDKKTIHGEVPVRLCNYMDVYGNDYITANLQFMEASATHAEIERFRVECGDVIVTKDSETPDDIGIPAVVVDEIANLVCGYHLALIKPHREKIDSIYLAKQLSSKPIAARFAQLANGSTRYGLSSSAIASTTVPLAPRAQQCRIAEILSTLDDAIEQTAALIAKHQQIKAGLMHDLFTRGVTPDGHLRPTREQALDLYKESPLGWIPKEWQYELLDDLAVRGSGHTPNKNFPEYWNGGIKWISLADSYRLDRLYIADTEYEISQLGIQNSSAVVHPAGTVVLSRDAGVGKSAITTQPMAVSQHFMCWRCDGRLNKHFLYYWLQFKKRMFENIAMGSTILTIGLPYFKKLKIAAPKDAEEQQMIGDSLLSADEQIFSLEADLEKIKQQKHGLMHDLLTGCVRVPLAKTKEVSTMAHAPSDLEPNT
jgi:type I restriction enzyme S subunit